MAATGSLIDAFLGGSLDVTKWAVPTRGPSWWTGSTLAGTNAQSAGQVQLAPADTADSFEGRSALDVALDMLDSEVVVKLTATETRNSDWSFGVSQTLLGVQTFRSIRFVVSRAFGTTYLQAFYSNFGSNGTDLTVTYSPTDHVWFKITNPQSPSNDFVWWTAPAGPNADTPGTWVEFRRLSVDGATPGTPFDATEVEPFFGALNWSGSTSILWTSTNFNYTSAAPTLVFNPLSGRGGGAAQPLVA